MAVAIPADRNVTSHKAEKKLNVYRDAKRVEHEMFGSNR
jgi:hypothetical protein